MLASPVRLFKEAPQDNVHREYTVEIVRDLFGTLIVVRRWGRIGSCGQRREHVCTSLDEAQALAAKLVREREARGYQRERVQVARSVPARAPRQPRRRVAAGQLSLWATPEAAAVAVATHPATAHQHNEAPVTAHRPSLPRHGLVDDKRQMWLGGVHATKAAEAAQARQAMPRASLIVDPAEAQRQALIDMLVKKSALLSTRKGESLGMKRAMG